MSKHSSITDIRRQYGDLSLSEENAKDDPFLQFEQWFADILSAGTLDPNAMVLATVDDKGMPDTRVVLLKGLYESSFVFYTNYQSVKAQQINQLPYAALNFYWPEMSRQIRVRGRVTRVPESMSDAYFLSRPFESQISAIASPQSQKLHNRNELIKNVNALIQKYGSEPIVRPQNWGGYAVIADEFEFWQGRDNRLHDRIQYVKESGAWIHRRLAP